MIHSRLFRLVFLAALAAVFFFSLSPAEAHAVLERSDPPDNVFLNESPRTVRLWFSEPVAIKFSKARLLDINGSQIGGVGIEQDPHTPRIVEVHLPPLGKGLYSLAWEVLSAADGHETTGLLVFGVGLAPQDHPQPGGQSIQAPPPAQALTRGISDVCGCSLFGALVISLGLLFPHLDKQEQQDAYEAARLRAANWSLGLAALGFISGFLLLWNQQDGVNGLRAMGDLLVATGWGRSWLLREWLLLIVVILLWRTRWVLAQKSSLLVWVGASFLAALALASQTFASHASGLEHPFLPLLSNFVHLLAAGVWTGGIAVLLTTARIKPLFQPQSADFSRALWVGFGRFAAVAAGIVFTTGLYNTALMVSSSGALLTSLYGNTLLLKLGLVALVCLGGLINSLSLHPLLALPLLKLSGRKAKQGDSGLRRIPLTIPLEAAFGLGVFLIAGYLGSTSPANGIGYRFSGLTQDKSISRQVNDLVLNFSVQPNLPGQNIIEVQTVSVRRPPPAEIARVIFRLSYQGESLGTQSIDAVEIEPGVYHLGGGYLSLPGPWKIDVVIRRLGLPDTVSSFAWNVLPIGNGPNNFSLQYPLLFLSGGMLGLTGVLAVRLFFLPKNSAKSAQANNPQPQQQD
jgi:copper transport protein